VCRMLRYIAKLLVRWKFGERDRALRGGVLKKAHMEMALKEEN